MRKLLTAAVVAGLASFAPIPAGAGPQCVWNPVGPPGDAYRGAIATSPFGVWVMETKDHGWLWDGASWTEYDIPSAPPNDSSFTYDQWVDGVAWDADGGAWLAETRYAQTLDGNHSYRQPIFAHWDGTSWSEVPSDVAPDTGYVDVRSIDAAGGTVMAVGMDGVRVWNGTEFVHTYGYRENDVDLDVVSGSSAWSVSDRHLFRYDGTSWTVVPTRDLIRAPLWYFTAVDAVGPHRVWAVGYRVGSSPHYESYSFSAVWNGRSWRVFRTPHPGKFDTLSGLTGSAGDLWAAGSYNATERDNRILIDHWNGKEWSVVGPRDAPGYVIDVALVGGSSVWGVGVTPSGVIGADCAA